VQKGAYLGCLEVPSVALCSTTAEVKTGASYYGRQHEFATTNSDQTVVVMQYDDYNSTSGTSTGVWYRNYTMLYDNAMLSPRWVAYSLSDWHFPLAESLGRRSWDANPSTTLVQYSGSYQESSTYDRGHMLANMMRNNCSSNSQKQTFFHTNQIPQVNSFNQGKWVALENKENAWRSECDTMYVVTGPIFDSNYTTTPDSRGTAIPVATRYFKAMIKCNWQSGELSEVKGIGFLFTHSSSSQNYNEAKCSIVDIESVLGYKLFANLPSKFATAKQNSTPSKFTSSW
jgi:endonuclease G